MRCKGADTLIMASKIINMIVYLDVHSQPINIKVWCPNIIVSFLLSVLKASSEFSLFCKNLYHLKLERNVLRTMFYRLSWSLTANDIKAERKFSHDSYKCV